MTHLRDNIVTFVVQTTTIERTATPNLDAVLAETERQMAAPPKKKKRKVDKPKVRAKKKAKPDASATPDNSAVVLCFVCRDPNCPWTWRSR